MKYSSLKKALSLNLSGGKGGTNWLFLIGAGTLVGAGALWLMGKGHEAKANFANSANSINPHAEGSDYYGDSMNSFVPIRGQNTDTYLHPMVYNGKRSFPDYTRNSNSIPTPFVEINFPQDRIGKGAKLANIIDKCTYVSDYGARRYA